MVRVDRHALSSGVSGIIFCGAYRGEGFCKFPEPMEPRAIRVVPYRGGSDFLFRNAQSDSIKRRFCLGFQRSCRCLIQW
jgi:hypothetical protein